MRPYRYFDPKPPAAAKLSERLQSAWIRWNAQAAQSTDARITQQISAMYGAVQQASTLRGPSDPPEPEVATVVPRRPSPVLSGGATP